ncbi:MAG: putative bifunctional diguanylate cyclase/phosphodiesterase [Actinomycetota bacterium]
MSWPVGKPGISGVSTLARVRAALPSGSTITPESWSRRHLAILVILWLHVPVLYVIGLRQGYGPLHPFLETAVVAIFAAAASVKGLSQDARASLATLGLVSSSAILVHLTGGLIEMHFHFFVMVAMVALYQSWYPFLLAIGFVLLHHGVIGAIDSSSVYNHPEALRSPWRWAGVHALFIAGESVAALTTWKLNELSLDSERTARTALEVAIEDLSEAQALTHIGSWDWDVATGRIEWSDELYRICGVASDFEPTYDGFVAMIPIPERGKLQVILEGALTTGEGFEYETRLIRPDGSVRLVQAAGRLMTDREGQSGRLVGTVQDITERKQLEEKVTHQAFHDSLTGLPNRALFIDRVEHARARQARDISALGVLFVDIDDFKTVNDTKGHLAGDALLQEVGQRIAGVLRSADTIARLGGDEFAVLLEDLQGTEEATGIADRILQTISSAMSVDENEVSISASVGIVIESTPGTRASDELLRDADIAMYAAKRKGKGSYEIFESAMRRDLNARLTLRNDLQRAIDEGEFFLQYQPIVQVKDGNVQSVEALVRWRHPERGVIPPVEFIPFAEENGQIIDIGRWVLRRACMDAARWQSLFPQEEALRVSVNVSPIQFHDSGFLEELRTILTEFSLAPNSLMLEITEGVLIHDSEAVARRLEEVKKLGVRLAIDDFGTGYSSLGYLRRFPIDLLKIDKTFVDFVASGPEESALARAVVKLGDTLGLSVVAEGVESDDQASVLLEMGCALAQGFLYSRPVDGHQIEALLSERETELMESTSI